MADYHFVTTWCLDAPIERVFAAIDDAARWPEWWGAVRRAELLADGDADGIGRCWALTWRGGWACRCSCRPDAPRPGGTGPRPLRDSQG
jgi:uncharacterized protein YndB with AHSA1/START domain